MNFKNQLKSDFRLVFQTISKLHTKWELMSKTYYTLNEKCLETRKQFVLKLGVSPLPLCINVCEQ